MQTKIPCVLMRGGTSKGPFFKASDLPDDPVLRDRVLIAAMGSPDARQIDGVGGANPLTSKVAIVKRSERNGVDLDYLFVQVVVDEPRASIKQNCGNILAGVGAFAVQEGLIEARGDETTLTVFMENSGSLADVTFATPGGQPEYDGDARIDGVPGTASPVMTNFRGTEGSTCGALLPTGNLVDTVNGMEVTCIDNGMPVVLLRAADFGLSGLESPAELEANAELKARIESIRLAAGKLMNLGDVTSKTVPKMSLISAPLAGGSINTRTFIPHRVHEAIGVLGSVSVASGCMLPGSVAQSVAAVPAADGVCQLEVEHPTGFFTVEMEVAGSDSLDSFTVKRAALLRTARLLMRGEVMVPAELESEHG